MRFQTYSTSECAKVAEFFIMHRVPFSVEWTDSERIPYPQIVLPDSRIALKVLHSLHEWLTESKIRLDLATDRTTNDVDWYTGNNAKRIIDEGRY